jgi:hypothetical protein
LLLHSLDDRTLDDIGLAPDDIERALAEFEGVGRHRSRPAGTGVRIGLAWPSGRSLWKSR